MNNPYYEPEDFGLELVGTVDIGDSWEFYIIIVWRNAAGELLYAIDAGCSCHAPGDEIELGDLTKGTFHEVAEKVMEHGRAGDEADLATAVSLVERMRNG